jgi:hypothetical protein
MVAASREATSVPSEDASSDARASRKSPERIARMLPQRALTLATPWRVAASSITSSWWSEPTWTSSHATPPVTASSEITSPMSAPAGTQPAAVAADTAPSSGRSRLPPALTRCEAISFIAGSSDSTAASNRFSTRSCSAGIAGSSSSGLRATASR